MVGAEMRHTALEKLIMALVVASRKLKHFFRSLPNKSCELIPDPFGIRKAKPERVDD